MNDEQIEQKLVTAHEKEADERKMEIYNLGWSQTEYAICSKTSKGYLTSEIDSNTLEITHNMEKY